MNPQKQARIANAMLISNMQEHQVNAEFYGERLVAAILSPLADYLIYLNQLEKAKAAIELESNSSGPRDDSKQDG